ncbi:MAG TPA: dUTP diphosphatase [Leptospiraceae bacterium]|nr:dUTP diphosphatase [Leptospiraceae bacterium]HMW58763.1 dUTP diphosphatase [Leptospiraceae bacterium]HMY45120.1 dUTP diphosphatase [Leptospiraceae bacterium]HNE21699.1 dUTP diphosphatase [Leptospiraceae bacterium]HNL01477.1 dUTP diphosphatase [Leptospiraceae bacterium]
MARIRIALKQGARIPARSTDGAAGYDVCALLPPDTEIIIAPGQRMLVPTGIFLDIPEGYFVTLRPRSGLALKNGITLLNSPATIDWDYRGELQVILANLGQDPFTIRSGDRIAQFLVEKWERADFEEISVESLTGTSRGAGGFGSTGLA